MLSALSYAQSSYVKAGYSPKEKSIMVKWFAEKNRFDDGVLIYRKDNVDNNWVKLTDKPIKKAAKLSEAESKSSDSTIAIYNYIVNNVPKDNDEYENWEFTLILQSLLNNNFAMYAGLGYSDTKIDAGKKYTYKVNYLRSGSEVELATSDETGMDDISATVNSTLALTQNKEKIFCNWTAEVDKFISYNIYRDSKKLNDQPVYVFDMDKKQAYLFSDSLTSEGTFNYSYTGLDPFGNESAQSSGVAITVESVKLPPRAMNVRYDGNNQLILYWRVSSTNNLKGFNIFRGSDVKGEFTKINSSLLSSTDTSYVDNTAELNKKYFYYVSSENNGGLINNSSVIAAASADYSKPVTPVNLTAVSDSVCIRLTWDKSTSTNVIGYKVYRNIKGNEGEFLLMTPAPLKETSYTDNLNKGTLNDFYYKVVAVNQKYMNSEYSQPIAIKVKDVKPPSVPTISEVSVENNIVTIKWQPLFETDLAGYKVYRSEDSLSGFTEISAPVKDKTSFADNSIAAGKTYYYKISSVDNSGNISMPSGNYMILIPQAEITAPSVKLNLTYSKENNSVSISWDAVQSSASPVKGYFLMRKDNDDEYAYTASEFITVTNFSDARIEAPAKYNYSLKIIYENGDVVNTPEQLIETN